MKTSHRRLVMRTMGIVFAISLSLGLIFTGVGLNGRSNVLTAHAAAPNLVKNADFESGTNDWFAWAGGAATGNTVVHRWRCPCYGTGDAG